MTYFRFLSSLCKKIKSMHSKIAFFCIQPVLVPPAFSSPSSPFKPNRYVARHIIFSAQGEGTGGGCRWRDGRRVCPSACSLMQSLLFRSKMHKTCFLLYITRASLLATLLLFFSPSCCFPLFYDPSPRLLRFSFSFSFLCFLFIRSVIHTDADVTHTAIQSGISGIKEILSHSKSS